MSHWYMVTLVGVDRPGIVAQVTQALYAGGGNLGEASMLRLGGNFTIMLMVASDTDAAEVRGWVAPVAEALGLKLHVDAIAGALHDHPEPDVRVTVYGADEAGIVARITGALAEAGLHILELESNVAGTDAAPLYVMQLEGYASQGLAALEAALAGAREPRMEVRLEPLDTVIG